MEKWTLFAIVSLISFFILHYVFGFYITWPLRLHHSIIGWGYIGLGILVWNWPNIALGFFLVGHHLITEGTII